jgi:large-conductance mechanosensitive channel
MTDVSDLLVLACAVFIGSVFKDFMDVFMKDVVYPTLQIPTIHQAIGSNELVQRFVDFVVGIVIIILFIRVVEKPFLKLISAINK